MREYWDNLSVREQRLAVLTGALLVLGVVFLGGYRAVSGITELDDRVAQLEQELVNLHEQEAQSASAEEAFRSMAAQHSSAWTQEEIMDRLGREIYRLALTDMNKQDPKQRDYMVQIPTLREGTLRDDNEGYREYHVGFRLEPAKVMNVLRFLERLQKSDQSLRIDALDLSRAPQGDTVETYLEITRTVLDSDPDAELNEGEDLIEPSLIADGGFELWESSGGPPGWETGKCRVTKNNDRATEGVRCLEAVAKQAGATLYAPVALPPDRSYRLSLDVTAETAVTVGVREPGSAEALTKARRVPGDGQTYRLEFVFTPVTQGSESATVWAPYLAIEEAGTPVYLDNIRLTAIGG